MYTAYTCFDKLKIMKHIGRSRPAAERSHPYHHGSLKQAALREAYQVLADQGVDAVSLRAIARVVRVTPNALYRHFKDKNALLAALAEEGFLELCRSFRKNRSKDPKVRFRRMAHSYVQFGMSKPAVLQLMFGQKITQDSERSGLKQAAEETFMELVQAAAAAAGTSPAGKESLQLAVACWSLVHGYTTLLMQGALDFVQASHGIERVVRFIDLNPRRSAS